MIKIELFEFRKRANSTAIPNFDGYSTIGTLKDETSILNPVLELASKTVTDLYKYNYAHIPIFNRYYFINDWRAANGVWIASLSVDVLASWKDDILSKECYVIRSERHNNNMVVDSTYPTTMNPVTEVNVIDTVIPFTALPANGVYVVGMLNGYGGDWGAITYYAFGSGDFKSFCEKVFGTLDYMNISVDEISTELCKTLVNPLQYITGVTFYPAFFDNLRTSQWEIAEYIRLGFWNIDVGEELPFVIKTNYTRTFSYSVDIPKHPQKNELDNGAFLDGAPYSKYILFFPGFGDIEIDPALIATETTLDFRIDLDITSGDAVLHSTDPDFLGTHYGKLGVQIPITQFTSDWIGAFSSVLGIGGNAIGSVATRNFDSLTNGLFNGVINAVQCAMPSASNVGAMGSILNINLRPMLKAVFYPVVDTCDSEFGAPCYQYRILEDFSGYVKTANRTISIFGAMLPEQESINDYLTGGCYIE